MADCVFCKIVAGQIPCHKVYEDEHILAFLDLSQVTPGHTLVIPKAHYENFLSVPKPLMHQAMDIAQRVGHIQITELLARGINVLTNCYPVAGQTIPHFHIHVIPRYEKGDGLRITMMDNSADAKLNLPVLAGKLARKMDE